MTTLLVGASGQVGRALAAEFASATLVTTSHRHAREGDIPLDLGDGDAVRSALARVRPDLVLLAGAMCNVDQCELEPEVCRRINTAGPALVAEYARTHGARVVFFSTDHVFDGSRDVYVEDDAPNPLSAYARSKAEAEVRIRELLPERHLIIRTGWVYGPDAERRNFALRLVDRISAGETVAVPSDQCGSPTYTADLASATGYLVERGAAGTFHASGPDFLDRGTLAQLICDAFGLDRGKVTLRPTSELGQAARRSLRVRLDSSKLRRAGAPTFRGVAEGMQSLAANHASPVSS